jgi:hypothetical protein
MIALPLDFATHFYFQSEYRESMIENLVRERNNPLGVRGAPHRFGSLNRIG